MKKVLLGLIFLLILSGCGPTSPENALLNQKFANAGLHYVDYNLLSDRDYIMLGLDLDKFDREGTKYWIIALQHDVILYYRDTKEP